MKIKMILGIVVALTVGSAAIAAEKIGKGVPPAVAGKPNKGARLDPAAKERERTGVLQSVDAARNTITIELQLTRATKFDPAEPTLKTYELTSDTEILVEAGRGSLNLVKDAKLSDLVAGALVTVRFSDDDDPKVESLFVSGPRINGVIESVDAAQNTITLAPSVVKITAEAGETKIYKLKADADIALNDGGARKGFLKVGDLADLKRGTNVFLRISPDLKEVVYVYASGPRAVGKIKSVNATENTVTLLVQPANKTTIPEEKTYSLRAANIFVEDGSAEKFGKSAPAQASIASLTEGATVQFLLSVDQTTVITLFTEGPVVVGILKTVDAERHAITLLNNQVEEAFTVAPDAKILINDREVPLVALQDRLQAEPVELQARLKLSADGKQIRSITVGEAGEINFDKTPPEKGAGKFDKKLKRAE